MYSETYKIAEHNIRICSLYDEVHTLCKDYQHNEYTDFTVEIKQQDIDFERRKSFDENIVQSLYPTVTLKPWLCTEKYAKS